MIQPVRTALTSFGMSGKVFHAPLLMANPGFNIVAVVQRNSASAKDVLPSAQIMRSFDDLLELEELELIVVNTPDNFHYEQAKKALEAGKHVVVEKPFVQTVEQGKELISLAHEKNLILSVFHNRRWDNGFLTLQRLINQGVFGRIVEYEARFERYRTFIQNSWKELAESGTGTLQNLGSHLIDQALVLFGRPDGVNCRMLPLRDNSAVSDYFDMQLTYPSVSVLLKASYLVREPGPAYVLHGVNGSFVIGNTDPQEEAMKNGLLPGSPEWGTVQPALYGLLNADVDGKPFRGTVRTEPGNYPAYYENIYSAIRHEEPLLVTPQQALDVIKIIQAASESNLQKREVTLVW
jgi:predicted dehydrogenase